jgi:hypothetical protein
LSTNSGHGLLAPCDSCFAADAALPETTVTQHTKFPNTAIWPPVALANGAAVDRKCLTACVEHYDTRVCEVVPDKALECASLPGHTCTLQAHIFTIELIKPGIVVMSVHSSCTAYKLHVTGWAEQSKSAHVHLEIVWSITLKLELLAL